MLVSITSIVSCLLLVLYIYTIKFYLDKILNSDEVTSVAVLHSIQCKIDAKSLDL
ncbi:hypothetical protein JN06_02568 [Bacteroides zoogleoformans]|nr:hypothetical protein JN06_02568 [Bacteroides zoogleoformans]